jgi:hypothetical protein
MRYVDAVYGEFFIEEPVVLDLIQAPSMQRLKGIDQAGYADPFFKTLTPISRFDHSLGVYLLLTRYNACLEERIAGLIHDVSHAVFSHAIDYVIGDEACQKVQSHQDNTFVEYVMRSEIPLILSRYAIDVEKIVDDSLFPLKEQILPDLCADRIDYILRTAVACEALAGHDVHTILEGLITDGKQWFFQNCKQAFEFADLFSSINRTFYCCLPTAAMFQSIGDYLRYSLARGYISYDDLYITDKEVLEKIERYHLQDKVLLGYFDRMCGKVPFSSNRNDFTARIFCKSRVVDPLFMEGNKQVRLSFVDPAWKYRLEVESTPKEYFVRFEENR